MNRLLLLCLFLVSILMPRLATAQAYAHWLAPTGPNYTVCFDPNGNFGTGAVITLTNVTYNDHSWDVRAPAGCTVAPSFTCQGTPCRTVNIDYPCCGTYTVISAAINTTQAPTTFTVTKDTAFATIVCPNTATATPSSTAVCEGATVSLVGNGAVSYTWYPSNGAPISTLNPAVFLVNSNTTFTMIGQSVGGCTVTATTSVAVQSATLGITPANQTMCVGSQVCFTAQPGAINNPSVAPGTTTTSVLWYDPVGTGFVSGLTTCTTASGGNYKAVLTHTGAAGTCTTEAFSLVTIGTSINMSAGSHSPNVCPNANVTLTAVSVQQNPASYTWTSSGGQTLTGNPVVFQPSVATCYTVDVDYTGCPGQATLCVGMASLTPTLTANNSSMCPGTAATLCASGGTSYTFNYYDPGLNSWSGIGTASTTSSCIAHTPSVNTPFFATYSVAAFDGGCSGGVIINISEYKLNPTFGVLGSSVCPNTSITFTSGNVGAGASYTAFSTYPANPTAFYVGVQDTFLHNPFPFVPPLSYTLNVDSLGCTGTAITQVYSLTLNPILSASSASICPGTQFTLESTGGAGTSYTFSAPPAPGTVIPNPGNTYSVVHTPLSLPQTFTVNVDSSNCAGSATLEVWPLDLSPTLTLTASPSLSLCPNSNFTISASMGAGTNYTFSSATGSVPLTSSNSAADSFTPAAGTYTVEADSLGCVGSQTIALFEYVIQPTLTVSPATVCAGIPVVLNATGGANTNYTFLRPDPSVIPPVAVVGNSLSSSNTATHNPGPTVITTYTVLVDSTQCKGFATASVSIAPGLTINAVAASQTVCSGETTTLSATGPTNAIYSWQLITGTNNPIPLTGGTNLTYTQVTQGIVVNPTINTQYIVTGVDPAGCTGTSAITVSINPTASLSISLAPLNTTICPGHSTTLTASGASNYTWAPGAGLLPSSTVPTVVASPSVTQTYTVLGTNNLGCYGSQTITVFLGTMPQPMIVPTSPSVCPGFNATLTAFGGNTFTWTSTTFSGSIAQQSVAGGPGTYSVIASNGGTCIDSTAITIYSLGPLSINVSQSSQTTCIANNSPKFSQPVTFTASGASNYIWQPYNPAYMTYSLGQITTVRPPATTCYTVTGYTSICSGTAAICVTVIPQFSMNVTPPLPAICLNDSLRLGITDIGALAEGPVSAFTYSWTEAQNAPPISMSDFLTPTITVFPKNTTVYTVEVKDSRSCASLPALVTVSVFPRPIPAALIPTINGVPTNTVCYVGLHTGPPDVILTLTGELKNANLPFGITPTYSWLAPPQYTRTSILTPSNNNQVTVSAPDRLPALAVYTLLAGYNGVPGCSEMATVSIEVVDCRPVSTVTGAIWATSQPIDTICTQDCITFISLTHTMAGGPQTYEWEFPGGSPSKSTDKNPTVCYNLPNTRGYDVLLRVTNPYPVAEGGSSRLIGALRQVKVTDVPNVSVVDPGSRRSDTTVRFGTEVNLSASGALWYSWSPNYNITSLTGENVTVKPFRSTQYVLTGYNSRSCASTDTIDVIVIEDCGEMFVPNAFSPNGDGHNEVLRVQGICLETLSFMVFSRWGEKVFETADQAVGWDGTYKGQLMNTGVFVYRLEGKTYDGKAYSLKGNITLIR